MKYASRWFARPTLASCAVLWALAAAGPGVEAAPVAYRESVSGDLGHTDPLVVFTFDVGVNTIDGETRANDGTNPTLPLNDPDAFAFVVPEGLAVTGGLVTLVDASPADFVR